ncbi:MAG: hypothetical protein LBK60_09675 [Verrucomicrobiales bacterium]|jgi:hypothetical protein|nr:hypothetical protein [Verrucomicrobiales bacterium]
MQATWIWFPGDFELWLSAIVQNRRVERGQCNPPFWRLDRPAQIVVFEKHFDLADPDTVTISAQGECMAVIDDQPTAARVITLATGPHHILLRVYNPDTFPAVHVQGRHIVSDRAWTAGKQNGQCVPADAWDFTAPDQPPAAYRLPTTPQAAVTTSAGADGHSLTVDFGQETFGYLQLHRVTGSGALTAWYGESAEEAAATTQAETWDTFHFTNAAAADLTSPHSRACRFVKLTWDAPLTVGDVSMLHEFLPVPHRGAFRCDDAELNRIWATAARTLHLSSREFFLDGIKRDRWVWSGDACQSYLMNYYLFFDNALVKRTTWALRGNDPVEQHINTILDYSFYWFIGIHDYYQHTADRAFLAQLYPKMVTLMDFCLARRNANGLVEGRPDDWVFIDWAPMAKTGELSFEQILLCRSLETMTLSARLMGDAAGERRYRALADDLRRAIISIFWDDQPGALSHHRVNGHRHRAITKYANIFALSYGYLDAAQAAAVKTNVLLNPDVQPITTPYMRFYELDALCRVRQHHHVLQEIKAYWGGMLRHGATSFWETYDPAETGAQHYAMYGRPYGKSLCHAWGASPLYLLGKHYLGVTPATPGYQTCRVEPHLGGLEWMEGTVPTPDGDITLRVTRDQITVDTAGGDGGVLIIHSATAPASTDGVIRPTAPGEYALTLRPRHRHTVNYQAAG